MAADPQALLAEDCCLGNSYSQKQLLAMQVQLLATIASMPADPQALLALDCCLQSYNEKRLMAMIVQLLQLIVDGGLGGGSITVGAGPPAPASGAVGDIYWDSTNKMMYVKDADGWNIH